MFRWFTILCFLDLYQYPKLYSHPQSCRQLPRSPHRGTLPARQRPSRCSPWSPSSQELLSLAVIMRLYEQILTCLTRYLITWTTSTTFSHSSTSPSARQSSSFYMECPWWPLPAFRPCSAACSCPRTASTDAAVADTSGGAPRLMCTIEEHPVTFSGWFYDDSVEIKFFVRLEWGKNHYNQLQPDHTHWRERDQHMISKNCKRAGKESRERFFRIFVITRENWEPRDSLTHSKDHFLLFLWRSIRKEIESVLDEKPVETFTNGAEENSSNYLAPSTSKRWVIAPENSRSISDNAFDLFISRVSAIFHSRLFTFIFANLSVGVSAKQHWPN